MKFREIVDCFLNTKHTSPRPRLDTLRRVQHRILRSNDFQAFFTKCRRTSVSRTELIHDSRLWDVPNMKSHQVDTGRQRWITSTISQYRAVHISSCRCSQWHYHYASSNWSTNRTALGHHAWTLWRAISVSYQRSNDFARKTHNQQGSVIRSSCLVFVASSVGKRIYLRYCQIDGRAYLTLRWLKTYWQHGNYARGGSVFVSTSREFSLNDDQKFEYAHSCTHSISVESFYHAQWEWADRWPCITLGCSGIQKCSIAMLKPVSCLYQQRSAGTRKDWN
jgi:hypothetical protein